MFIISIASSVFIGSSGFSSSPDLGAASSGGASSAAASSGGASSGSASSGAPSSAFSTSLIPHVLALWKS